MGGRCDKMEAQANYKTIQTAHADKIRKQNHI